MDLVDSWPGALRELPSVGVHGQKAGKQLKEEAGWAVDAGTGQDWPGRNLSREENVSRSQAGNVGLGLLRSSQLC